MLARAHGEDRIGDAALASSEAQARDFWDLRESLSEVQKAEGGSIKHDVSVPLSRLPEFLDRATRACEAALPGLRVCAFGHFGDGNIHFNLSQPVGMDRAAFLALWEPFNRIVHDIVYALDGSIAAEHGVGLLKREELGRYADPVALDLMRTLKAALDPRNILNPGKVLPIKVLPGEVRPGFDV
jgi:FAD/FMN-containing dehydrogenase